MSIGFALGRWCGIKDLSRGSHRVRCDGEGPNVGVHPAPGCFEGGSVVRGVSVVCYRQNRANEQFCPIQRFDGVNKRDICDGAR